MSVVVERDGADDACVDLFGAGTVAELLASVCAQLQLPLGAEGYSFSHKGVALVDAEAALVDVGVFGEGERVEVRLTERGLARERLQSERGWDLAAALASPAEAGRRLHDVLAAEDHSTLRLFVEAEVLSTSGVEAVCCTAAKEGALMHLQALCDAGCAVDARDRFGQTAAMHAVFQGHDDVLDELMRRGCDVDIAGPHGDTCLTLAAQQNRWVMVRRLTEHGCDPNAANRTRGPCLTIAAAKNEWGVVEYLLEHAAGVDVNASGCDEDTCLAIAARRGQWDIVEKLVDHGAGDYSRDAFGHCWIVFAAHAGRWPLVMRLLDSGADANRRPHFEDSLLMIAAKTGTLDALSALLAYGADPMDVNLFGDTAVTLAALAGEWAAVRAVVEHTPQAAAYRNPTAESGAAATAAQRGEVDILKILLMHGVPIDAVYKNNDTCLTLAAAHGKWHAVRYLLSVADGEYRYADPARYSADKAACLAAAARHGAVEEATWLLDGGHAPLLGRDMFGDTCITTAAEHEQWDVVHFLVGYVGRGGGQTCDARVLIAMKNRNGNTCVALAAQGGQLALLKELVASSGVHSAAAPSDLRDALFGENIFGDTPLALAVEGRHWEVAEYLSTQCGCIVEGVNRDGLSPAAVAAARGAPQQIVELLGGDAGAAAWAEETSPPCGGCRTSSPPPPRKGGPSGAKVWGGLRARRAGYVSEPH